MGKAPKPFIISASILTVLLITGSSFYWFSIRPAKIRKECAFVKRHEDAKPEIKAVCGESCWSEEYKARLAKCQQTSDGSSYEEFKCMGEIKSKEDTPYKPAVPAKDWIEPATEKEYNACLHSRGL